MRIGRLVRHLPTSALLGLCAGLFACHPKDAQSHSDVGAACVIPTSAEPAFFGECNGLELSPNAELRIDVDFGLCLSSSCDHLLRASCEVKRDGAVITVEARADVESDSSGSCTDDCGSVSASCALGTLPEGSYELRYGDATLAFDIPSTTSLRCAGNAFGRACCDDASDCGSGKCEENNCRQ